MKYVYNCVGTCSSQISFHIHDDVVTDICFQGGCPGNTKAVAALCNGKTVEEITSVLDGITCGVKPTSCGDQLARAVLQAYEEDFDSEAS
ncbi:MAG TPA: TIGR03905 family TSCPD domain-containing protein [Clostridiales bacterium]|jgi:uncharacterized protein (TIGR03905 family)|nr:TIGR03905 family TSCPD domain-containing protein [Clostridiales bacterium]